MVAAMAGPLAGVKVVELGVWVAGPAAAVTLGDWGADVVKVEPLDGDPARLFTKIYGVDLPTNPIFDQDNRNKLGIAVDITTPEGRQIMYDLLDDADVFVTNVRAKALARAGLDHQTLLERNPRLIYGHLTGYGLEGPDADRAAFDIAAFWSRAGIASMLTPEGADLPFQRGGMGDHTTGVTFAGAICAALFHRERSGEGQLVSSSLLRQGVYTISFDLSTVLGWGAHPAIGRRDEMRSPTANNYGTADGRRFWVVGLQADRHWPPLARVAGHPEWVDDPRFVNGYQRAMHHVELRAMLDEIFATKTLDEWAEIFDTEPDMFWAPVNTAYDVIADPQVLASGALIEVPDGAGTTTQIATPADFHGTPLQPRWMAPTIGQHTEQVLRALGRTADEIAALQHAGVIATTPPEP